MNDGTLNIQKTKKGKWLYSITFTKKNDKPGTLQFKPNPDNPIDSSLNGEPVQYEKDEQGRFVKVSHNGNIIFEYKAPEKPGDSIFKDNNKKLELPDCDKLILSHTETVTNPSMAPYNFVPLNTEVVPCEKIPSFDRYHSVRRTGWIELEVENLTPMFFADTLDKEETRRKNSAPADSPYQHETSYSPTGDEKYAIPGSTFRGMCRSAMEIISHGLLEFFEQDQMFFSRFLASKEENLARLYKETMVLSDENDKYLCQASKAGCLVRAGNRYQIIPAMMDTGQRVNYYKVDKEELRYSGINPPRGVNPYIKKVYFKNDKCDFHDHHGGRRKIYYGKVSNIMSADGNRCPAGWETGTLVCSGYIPGKHMHFVINEKGPPNSAIDVADDIIERYMQDNRRRASNLIDLFDIYPEGVACFYISHKNDSGTEIIDFFGHTGMFRIPYRRTVKEHVPEVLWQRRYYLNECRLGWIEDEDEIPQSVKKELSDYKQEEPVLISKFEEIIIPILERNISDKSVRSKCRKLIEKHSRLIDIPGAIFGNSDLFASRVFFEDILICEDQGDLTYSTGKWLKTLSTPNQTCIQHYLVQPEHGTVFHWDDCTSVRGIKVFWQKNSNENSDGTMNWEKQKANQRIDKKIKPIKPNKKFKGVIRFENLSDIELGGLLFCLQLPEDCYHKLGMAKPLSFGTIDITTSLFLSDRKKRYESLFEEWDDHPCSVSSNQSFVSPETINSLKEQFETYILTCLNDNGSKNLWETDRLNQYMILLNKEIGEALDKNGLIDYLGFGDHEQDKLLEKPDTLADKV